MSGGNTTEETDAVEPSEGLPSAAETAIRRIAVIGAGTMGAQIAQQAALHGFPVRLHDQSPEQVERAFSTNRRHLERRVAKGALSAGECDAALARVQAAIALDAAVAEADLVIEAIVEDLEAKRCIFQKLDRLAPPHAILATNSSTMTVSE
ncbi:MAG: hypothetical protein C4346_14065, partial [Chloroflexota bacterium]